jgi:ketosteroid isomerase-like protein
MMIAAAVLACACGNKHDAPATGSAGSGSAGSAGSGSGSATAPVDLAATFAACWDHHNRSEWIALEHCYTKTAVAESPGRPVQPAVGPEIADAARTLRTELPDLRGEPRLILVDGSKLVAAVRLTGKHAKVGKSIGVLGGIVINYDATGLVTHESDYFDATTITSQLVPSTSHPSRAADSDSALAKQTVVAAHDAKEAANVETVKQLVAAFGKHDFAAFGALLPDDATWSDQAEAKDWTKAELIADHQAGVQSFPDIAMTVQDVWGAGDYVVEVATIDGTTPKKISVPYLAIHQVVAGKVAHTWVFEQGEALPSQLGLK